MRLFMKVGYQVKKKSLLKIYPKVAELWHPTKNHNLKPENVSPNSGMKAWWKCPLGSDHEWPAKIAQMAISFCKKSASRGCPMCRGLKVVPSNSLEGVHPELAREWHPVKNELKASEVHCGKHKKGWWQCIETKKHDHDWEASIKSRVFGNKCPVCRGSKVVFSNSLEGVYPELAREWHPVKNELKASEVHYGRHKPGWWQCIENKNHEWETAVDNRTTNGSRCPYCTLGFTIENIRLFILSLIPYLSTLDPAELYVIFQQKGLLSSRGKGRFFVKNFVSSKKLREELEAVVGDPLKFEEFVKNQKGLIEEDDVLHTISESDLEDQSSEVDFPIIETKDILSVVEAKIISSADAETIDFLIESAVAKIWRHIFRDEKNACLQLEKYKINGEYARKVKELFLESYEGTKNIEIPRGYSVNPPDYLPKKEELTLMQRNVAYNIKTKKRFGNWSGTGAGKTLSAILASRVIGARLTIICCPSDVINTWKRQIRGSYSDSIIYTKESILQLHKDNTHKYLILNWEFFQQDASEAKLKKLLENCKIDFIVLDEIHYSKQRVANVVSKRKMLLSAFLSESSDKNQTLSVLGMSATPVINTLFEGKTLIELITGVCHDELDAKATPSNCIALYKMFVRHGIRYIPNYNMQFNQKIEHINCGDFVSEIRRHKSIFELEAIATKAKLPFILKQLRCKTIVYIYYRAGIESILQEAIIQKGWKVALFNGDTKAGLDQFINGDADILIASSCIGTGIDGLQKVCNRLIIGCLPWTDAEFKQLIGRVYRQGQTKNWVDVMIPLTFAEINGKRWSWCESRWKRIQFKRSIADAAVDGVIPKGHLRSNAQAHKDIMKWFDRLDKEGVHELERSKIFVPLKGDSKKSPLRRVGDLTRMNQSINKVSSSATHERFVDNPEDWKDYHKKYKEARKNWDVIPYQEAIKWCERRPHMIIGDFGCGEAFFVKELKNKVYSFDYIAINENVIACDMAKVPCED